jgi:hypothetical protein
MSTCTARAGVLPRLAIRQTSSVAISAVSASCFVLVIKVLFRSEYHVGLFSAELYLVLDCFARNCISCWIVLRGIVSRVGLFSVELYLVLDCFARNCILRGNVFSVEMSKRVFYSTMLLQSALPNPLLRRIRQAAHLVKFLARTALPSSTITTTPFLMALPPSPSAVLGMSRPDRSTWSSPPTAASRSRKRPSVCKCGWVCACGDVDLLVL